MKLLSLPQGFERLVGDLGTGTDVQRDQLVSMVTQTLASPETEAEPTKIEYDKSMEAESTNIVHDRTIIWFEVNSFH